LNPDNEVCLQFEIMAYNLFNDLMITSPAMAPL
jgi:hypothetical protein